MSGSANRTSFLATNSSQMGQELSTLSYIHLGAHKLRQKRGNKARAVPAFVCLHRGTFGRSRRCFCGRECGALSSHFTSLSIGAAEPCWSWATILFSHVRSS